ncbi:hypothetical protein DBA29_04875 [Xenophilus aerolatus]|nr:hypothetical protein [Xenophilus aerolatus]
MWPASTWACSNASSAHGFPGANRQGSLARTRQHRRPAPARAHAVPPQHDGPGSDSAAIGNFLAERGVGATFFVVGKCAEQRPDALAGLHAAGHIIGKHTYDHPDMPYYVAGGRRSRADHPRRRPHPPRQPRRPGLPARDLRQVVARSGRRPNIEPRSLLGHVAPCTGKCPISTATAGDWASRWRRPSNTWRSSSAMAGASWSCPNPIQAAPGLDDGGFP